MTMKTNESFLGMETFLTTRVHVQEPASRHGTGTPTAMSWLLKISPIPPLVFALAAILLVHPAAAQQTQIRLSTMTPSGTMITLSPVMNAARPLVTFSRPIVWVA